MRVCSCLETNGVYIVHTRPISILPIISKVVERSPHVIFTEYLDSNGKISQYQSGNRKIQSTETALLYFIDKILKNMDMKQVSRTKQ